MNLLTICQNVARETGLPIPSTIIGNNSITERKLLAAAQRTGKQLSRKDWCVLILEHAFETCANQEDYPLPDDYKTLIDLTTWNRAQADPMFRLSPQNWQELKSGLTESIAFDNYRIKAKKGVNRFFIDPTPTSVEEIVFEYQSTSWVKHSENSPITFTRSFDADGDEVLFDEDLFELGTMWRFLKSQGEPYFEEKDEFERTLSIDFSDDCGPESINMVKRRIPFVANVGQVGFGN